MNSALDILSNKTAAHLFKIAKDLGYDPQQIAEKVARRIQERQEAKYRQMLRVSAAMRHTDAVEHKVTKAGGHEFRKLFEIPVLSYHYWGRRLGYECWADTGFCAEIIRDNPQWKVQYAKESRITAGITLS